MMRPDTILWAFMILVLHITSACTSSKQIIRKPVPDKLVVFTFDDGVVSHATFVAPLSKKYVNVEQALHEIEPVFTNLVNKP
jgi:hypothetical protein